MSHLFQVAKRQRDCKIATELSDGWFEDNGDGTLDYIAILKNGEVWRLKNAFLSSVSWDGLEYSDGPMEVTLTQAYPPIA
jgi:hypothetical protein